MKSNRINRKKFTSSNYATEDLRDQKNTSLVLNAE